MTSARKIASNRRNAKKSTGPKTKTGKWKSSRNAFRHGLAVAIGSQSNFAETINRLTQALAGDIYPNADLARKIAEAEVDLLRIRAMRASHFTAIGSWDGSRHARANLAEDLRRLERYEQRAYSRRKRAVKALIRNS